MEKFARKNIIQKCLLISLFLSCTGCASVTIPNYIQDKNPYKQVFYASFDKTRETVVKTLEDSGWVIEKEAKPALFERERDLESDNKQTLIFTKVRQISFFLGSRYTRINAYVHEMANSEIEVEIRYIVVTSMVFKSFYGYKKDQAVERIFNKIEENLHP